MILDDPRPAQKIDRQRQIPRSLQQILRYAHANRTVQDDAVCKSPFSARDSTRRWDADDDGAAGAVKAALGGAESLVETYLDGGQVIVAAAYGEAFARDPRVVLHEQIHNLVWRRRDLLGQALEFAGDDNGTNGGACRGEEVIGAEAGTGAVSVPFVLQQAGIGVDVGEG